MSDWKGIQELKLGDRGRTIDIKHKKRLYRGLVFTGVDMQSETVDEINLGGDGKERTMGRIACLIISTTEDTIGLSMTAEWRYSDA